MGFETPKKEEAQSSDLSPEQQRLVEENKNKGEALFEALERGGGNVEVQEAKLRVEDLTEKLEMFKNDPRTRNDMETLKWYEREIELNQRVASGEKLVDVLDSMQSEKDKKRIEETRKRLNEMQQL